MYYLVVFAAMPVSADIIRVPTQRASIGSAVRVAADRDTILVGSGTYVDNINFIGKQLVIKSMWGPDSTILIPKDQYTPMLRCVNRETGNCLFEGFTITGYNVGQVTEPIVLMDFDKLASPVVRNLIVRDNVGVTIARIRDDGPLFRRCLFYNNSGGPVMAVYGGVVSFLNCTIDRCEAGFYAVNADAEVRNCIISNCTQYAVRGLIPLFDYNNVWNNGLPSDSGARTGLHDISGDPMFIDAQSGNYGLRTGSPCIDQGDPNIFFNDPDGSRSDIGIFPYLGTTGVEDDGALPISFSLDQNFPNPFNPTTRISYSLPKRSRATLVVYNSLGQRVKTLIEGTLPAGEGTAVWDGRTDAGEAASSGVYFYRLVADDYSAIRKMVLVK